MELISKILELFRQEWPLQLALALFIIWLALHLICWLCGLLALGPRVKKKEIKPRIAAYLPGWQIWCELRLAGMDKGARQVEVLLWWSAALLLAGVSAVVWAAVCYMHSQFIAFLIVALVALMLLIAALMLYIRYRVLEYQALKVLFPQKPMRVISLIGIITAIPLQRILLMLGYAK